MSETLVKQYMARVDRSPARTDSMQRIINCTTTIEEKVELCLNNKVKCIDMLNDIKNNLIKDLRHEFPNFTDTQIENLTANRLESERVNSNAFKQYINSNPIISGY